MGNFRENFADWEWRLLTLEGETPAGVAEIKAAIREDWANPSLRASWRAQVADEAEYSRMLKALSLGITANVRSKIAQEVGAGNPGESRLGDRPSGDMGVPPIENKSTGGA